MAASLGVEQEFTLGRTEGDWIRVLYDKARRNQPELSLPEYDEAEAAGIVSVWRGPHIAFKAFRESPDEHPLATASGKIELFSEAILRDTAGWELREGDTLIVESISRFARNTVDCLQAVRQLKQCGVQLRFLSEGQACMGDSEFILTVYASLAQEESAHLSKRIKFGKDINARRGRVPPVIFGYTRTGLFSLRIQPREAETVREMFRLYLAGMGAAGIAAHLNHAGRFTKRGNRWDARGVRRCLDNSIYCGVFVNHKSTVVDYLEGKTQALPQQDWYVHARPEWAIVSRELFEAVQGERRHRRAIAAQGKACGTNRNT